MNQMNHNLYHLSNGWMLYTDDATEVGDGSGLVFDGAKTAFLQILTNNQGQVGIQALKVKDSPVTGFAAQLVVAYKDILATSRTDNEQLLTNVIQVTTGLIISKPQRPHR